MTINKREKKTDKFFYHFLINPSFIFKLDFRFSTE